MVLMSLFTRSEGASAEDLDVHQRHAMVTKPQFKVLVSTLQSVLDLRSGAKTAFTPTRGKLLLFCRKTGTCKLKCRPVCRKRKKKKDRSSR